MKGEGMIYKQVVCWMQPGKTSGAKLVTDGAGWAHSVCIDAETIMRKKKPGQDESLF
jgi:hypothetical protein|tara:strand:- start:703 stop:873 length:171 start_codon:yes stop_codon:yes gene_type:complete